jgi:hypothetical protein
VSRPMLAGVATTTLHVVNPTMPATGAPVTQLVVGAALVLVVGVGLSIVARRRPLRA